MTSPTKLRYLNWLCLGAIAFIATLVIAQQMYVDPLTFDDSMLSEAALQSIALNHAHNFGLAGEPQSEKSVLMSFGSWLTMRGTAMTSDVAKNFGYTRQTPLYVYQVSGEIPTLQMFGGFGGDSIRYTGMTIALNAETGEIFGGEFTVEGNTSINIDLIPVDSGEPTPRPSVEATAEVEP